MSTMESYYKTILNLIAQSPNSDSLFQSFLKLITEIASCDSAVFLITDLNNLGDSHSDYIYNVPQEHQNIYESYYNQIDTTNETISKSQQDLVFVQDLPDELTSREVESEFMAPNGYKGRAVFAFPRSNNYVTNLYLCRDGVFSENDKAMLIRSTQSIRLTVQEILNNERRRNFARSLLNATGSLGGLLGYVIVDDRMNLVDMDSDLVFLFVKKQIKIENKKVHIYEPELANIIDMSIRFGAALTYSAIDSDFSYDIAVAPTSLLKGLLPWEMPPNGLVIAVYDCHRCVIHLKKLMDCYGLTKTEAETTLHFSQKPHNKLLASELSKAPETVRTHVKRAMQKMGVHSQSELVRLVLTITMP
ncbi:helix-turn-helix transcriptional regulator [Hahella sp. HN01]|uniref:helix-turn-helix transcriptional regulator n=1 Tax=Hahella sp. HN01 TaxID=2847262 RepID=UPI001C1EBCFB|nr:helix-turn-helix transcriptional regulator [Hahella sp. HN01]